MSKKKQKRSVHIIFKWLGYRIIEINPPPKHMDALFHIEKSQRLEGKTYWRSSGFGSFETIGGAMYDLLNFLDEIAEGFNK